MWRNVAVHVHYAGTACAMTRECFYVCMNTFTGHSAREEAVAPILQMNKLRHSLGNMSKVNLIARVQSQILTFPSMMPSCLLRAFCMTNVSNPQVKYTRQVV